MILSQRRKWNIVSDPEGSNQTHYKSPPIPVGLVTDIRDVPTHCSYHTPEKVNNIGQYTMSTYLRPVAG